VDGQCADLLRAGANRSATIATVGSPSWPKNPRALAGRLRPRADIPAALGIDIAFSREGRAGSRIIIRMHASLEDTVSTVSTVATIDSSPQPADDKPCCTGPTARSVKSRQPPSAPWYSRRESRPERK